jgi:hypothetical protein
MTSNNRAGLSLSGLSTKTKIGIGCGGFFALLFITASCAAVVDTLANGAPEEPAVADAEPSPTPEPEESAGETEPVEEPEPSLAEAVEEQAVERLGPGREGDGEPYEWWDLVTGWSDGEPGEVLVNTSLPADSPYANGEDGPTSNEVAEEMCVDVAFLEAMEVVEGIERVEIRDESDVAVRGCEPIV